MRKVLFIATVTFLASINLVQAQDHGPARYILHKDMYLQSCIFVKNDDLSITFPKLNFVDPGLPEATVAQRKYILNYMDSLNRIHSESLSKINIKEYTPIITVFPYWSDGYSYSGGDINEAMEKRPYIVPADSTDWMKSFNDRLGKNKLEDTDIWPFRYTPSKNNKYWGEYTVAKIVKTFMKGNLSRRYTLFVLVPKDRLEVFRRFDNSKANVDVYDPKIKQQLMSLEPFTNERAKQKFDNFYNKFKDKLILPASNSLNTDSPKCISGDCNNGEGILASGRRTFIAKFRNGKPIGNGFMVLSNSWNESGISKRISFYFSGEFDGFLLKKATLYGDQVLLINSADKPTLVKKPIVIEGLFASTCGSGGFSDSFEKCDLRYYDTSFMFSVSSDKFIIFDNFFNISICKDQPTKQSAEAIVNEILRKEYPETSVSYQFIDKDNENGFSFSISEKGTIVNKIKVKRTLTTTDAFNKRPMCWPTNTAFPAYGGQMFTNTYQYDEF